MQPRQCQRKSMVSANSRLERK